MKASHQIGFQPFASALDLPRRKAAASALRVASQSAIGLGNMRGEREHHVIVVKLQADEKGILCGQRAGKTGNRVVIPRFEDCEFDAAQ
jgi:hypothetical protein